MTLLAHTTPSARQALSRAGDLAGPPTAGLLTTDLLLLALTETPGAAPTLARYGVAADAVRADLVEAGRLARWSTEELLRSIGVDAATVRAAAGPLLGPVRAASLRRHRVRPLHVTLDSPSGQVQLSSGSRKVVEVAAWTAGRRTPVTGEHLLQGLLADGRNAASATLRRLGVDHRALWTAASRAA